AVVPEEPGTAPAAAPAAAPAPRRGLAMVRSDTGERINLAAEVITIGRSRDRGIVVDDTRVSRAHAHIEPRKAGWALLDEGSANGTRVNGQDLPQNRPCALRVGDVVAIGPVELTVVAGESPAPGAGSRALDDSDRTRISGEVLPPDRRPGR
ncbi:MAG: domain containing protein, partial [Acidimicrobiales bacterium]|nr:domain containing protein [Acidimicrobiales bacterium]